MARATQRAYQEQHGDPLSPAWDDAPDWDRESALEGVLLALGGASPAECHEAWCRRRRAAGWTYGPVRDEPRQRHPNLVPYADLSAAQRRKDKLFVAVVSALA